MEQCVLRIGLGRTAVRSVRNREDRALDELCQYRRRGYRLSEVG